MIIHPDEDQRSSVFSVIAVDLQGVFVYNKK